MDLNELRQKIAKLTADQRAMLDGAEKENRDLTPEEDAKYKAMDADFLRYHQTLEREEKLLEKEAELAKTTRAKTPGGAPGAPAGDPKKADEQRALALAAWLRVGTSLEITDEQRAAAAACQINFDRKEITVGIERNYRQVKKQYRALSTIAGPSGGFLVPDGFVNSLEMALLDFGGMRQISDTIRTASGNDLPWPTSNDTNNKGERLSENTDFGAGADPSFGAVIFKAYKYSSKPIFIPYELLEDSIFDMPNMIGAWAGERIGRIQNDEFTTGSGAAMPMGIVNAATLGKTAASATAIVADEIIDLVHSVDPAYRVGAGLMFHDNILLAIRKLKASGTGEYLWEPSVQAGVPAQIFGQPYSINQSMASAIATTNRTIIFGQLNKYKIRDVNTIRLMRLNERYAEKDLVAFIAYMRSDGALIDAGTRPVKYLQQA